jgi:hypothetical protein
MQEYTNINIQIIYNEKFIIVEALGVEQVGLLNRLKSVNVGGWGTLVLHNISGILSLYQTSNKLFFI